MLQSEKDWWDRKIREVGVTFPKRCPSCRAEKRRTSSNQPPSIQTIITKLEEMSMAAIADAYNERSDQLAQELADLARHLEPYKNWRR